LLRQVVKNKAEFVVPFFNNHPSARATHRLHTTPPKLYAFQ
jgi:hypothetical protein